MLPPILSLPAPLRLFFAPSPPRALGCHRVGLCERYTEPQMVIGGTFVSLVVGYALGCMPYVLLDWLRWPPAAAYKLQPSRYVSRRVALHTSAYVLFLFVCVMLPLIVVGSGALSLLGVTLDPDRLPSAGTIAVQTAYFFLVEDFGNYWLHRALHTPWLYQAVHRVHHEHDAPFALAATYAHPVEVVVLGLPTFAGPLAVGPHLLTLWVWVLLRNYEAIDIHSGYELPAAANRVAGWIAGAAHHDYHHAHYSGNFASVFTWCDRLYGTSIGFEALQARKAAAAAKQGKLA